MRAETLKSTDTRRLALQVVAAYVVVSSGIHAWNASRGNGDARLALIEVLMLAAVVAAMRGRHWVWQRLGDWLPLLSLPLLYGGLQWSMLGGGLHDAVVQSWDRAVFGTDPARTMAGAMPSVALSEILHFAYFSYYGIIYFPALYLYVRSDGREAFRELVFSFTLAMVASFVAFTVFPVAGPRYEWAAPAGVPDGPMRRVVLSVLQAGSTRGTAFPSSHVAIALAIALAVLRWRRGLGVALVLITVLLGAGAVYGGFHYATDIVAGTALGVGCWGISRLSNRRSFEAGRETRP